MLRVGLTGGVASGKSAVARLLAARGAAVRDADVIVEELYQGGRAGARAVERLFGATVLGPDGGVDRTKLAARVLADAEQRAALERVVHPLVREELATWLKSLSGVAVAVVEAALLVETGAFRDYDRLVVVLADLDLRRRRALAAGWDAERFARVVAAQASDAARVALADHVIRNDRDLAALERETDAVWAALLREAIAIEGVGPDPS